MSVMKEFNRVWNIAVLWKSSYLIANASQQKLSVLRHAGGSPVKHHRTDHLPQRGQAGEVNIPLPRSSRGRESMNSAPLFPSPPCTQVSEPPIELAWRFDNASPTPTLGLVSAACLADLWKGRLGGGGVYRGVVDQVEKEVQGVGLDFRYDATTLPALESPVPKWGIK